MPPRAKPAATSASWPPSLQHWAVQGAGEEVSRVAPGAGRRRGPGGLWAAGVLGPHTPRPIIARVLLCSHTWSARHARVQVRSGAREPYFHRIMISHPTAGGHRAHHHAQCPCSLKASEISNAQFILCTGALITPAPVTGPSGGTSLRLGPLILNHNTEKARNKLQSMNPPPSAAAGRALLLAAVLVAVARMAVAQRVNVTYAGKYYGGKRSSWAQVHWCRCDQRCSCLAYVPWPAGGAAQPPPAGTLPASITSLRPHGS